MKSAIELAMERTKKFESGEKKTGLTEEQRQKISDVKQEYEAKIAEKEIMLQTKINQLAMSIGPREFQLYSEELRQQFLQEKQGLTQERDQKIAAIEQSLGT